jgi:restriction system protein
LPPRRSARSRRIATIASRTRIILIDGTELARLMIAHGVGVTPVAVYELKRVDSDFFAED